MMMPPAEALGAGWDELLVGLGAHGSRRLDDL